MAPSASIEMPSGVALGVADDGSFKVSFGEA